MAPAYSGAIIIIIHTYIHVFMRALIPWDSLLSTNVMRSASSTTSPHIVLNKYFQR